MNELIIIRIGFTVFIVVFMIVVYFLAAPFLSGWSKLVAAYPHSGTLPNKKYVIGFSVRLGNQISPEPGIAFSMDENGLYMGKCSPLSLGFSPIFIPWPDIIIKKSKNLELILEKLPSTPILITPTFDAALEKKNRGSTFIDDLLMSSPQKPIAEDSA